MYQWIEFDKINGDRVSIRLDQIVGYEPYRMNMPQDQLGVTSLSVSVKRRDYLLRHPYFDVREVIDEMNADDSIKKKSISRQPLTHGDGGETLTNRNGEENVGEDR